MPKNKPFHILTTIHLVAVGLALLRLCFIPFNDHLRYGIGHAICWTVVLSALLVFFYVPKAIRWRRWLKYYLGLYLAYSCFLLLYPITIVTLFVIAVVVPGGNYLYLAEDYVRQSLFPKTVECENEYYIIRSWYDVEHTDNNNVFYLYKKGTFTEQLMRKGYAGDMEYETYSATRIVAVNEQEGYAQVEVAIRTGERVKSEIQTWEIR